MNRIKLSYGEWLLTFWERIQDNKIIFLPAPQHRAKPETLYSSLYISRELQASSQYSRCQNLDTWVRSVISAPYFRLAGREILGSGFVCLLSHIDIVAVWHAAGTDGFSVSPRKL